MRSPITASAFGLGPPRVARPDAGVRDHEVGGGSCSRRRRERRVRRASRSSREARATSLARVIGGSRYHRRDARRHTRGGVRLLRGAHQGALRELSRGPVRAAGPAALRARDLRLRARRGRFRRRADLRGRARSEKLDQWEARLDAAYRGEAEGPIFMALAETVRRLDIPKQLLLDLLSAFRQDTRQEPLRHLGRAPRLLPPLGQSRRPARAPRLRGEGPRAAAAVRRDLHRRSSSRTTGRTPRSTTRAAASTCRRSCSGATASSSFDFSTRPRERRLARADGRADRPQPRAVRRGPPALRPRRPRAALRDAAHLARRDVDPRPHRGRGRRRLPAPAAPRAARQGGARLARLALARRHERERVGAPHAAERDQLLLRVPDPAARRSAARSTRSTPSAGSSTTASTSPTASGRRASRAGRTSSTRAYAGAPETELGRELAETVARFPIPRGAFEDIVAGCRMDLDHAALRDLRRPARLLRARRLGGRARLDRDLRLRRPGHARLRDRAGPRAPAHQHPARRRTGRARAAASTCRSRTWSASA